MAASLDGCITRAADRAFDFLRSLVFSALLGFAAPASAVPVTILDWNVYFGADVAPVVTAPSLADVPLLVKTAFQQAQANDFNLRVIGLANEIQRTQPHLIGLQEAAILSAVSLTGVPTYNRDFVQILNAELASRGLAYSVAVVNNNSSVTLPSGNNFASLEGFVTLTDRDVILRRNDVTINGVKSVDFINDLVVPSPAGPLASNRGYVSVDAVVDGASFRFVSTHLELPSPVQMLQLGEILAGNSDAARLILAGDLNSRSDGLDTPTYLNALAAGFGDIWASLGVGSGFTCCELPGLNNPVPLLDERIDYILYRGPGIDPLAVDILGETTFRGSAPLYVSDHAGLVATFSITAIPEPGTIALLGIAVLVLGWVRRRAGRVGRAAAY
jgi:hypothetical protein